MKKVFGVDGFQKNINPSNALESEKEVLAVIIQ